LKGLIQGYAGEKNPFGGKDKVIENGKFIINPQFEWTGGGFISNAEDLARWAKLMYEGKAFDASLLPVMLEGIDSPQLGAGTKYGLGVIIRKTRAGLTYGHSGFFPGYITEMAYFPEHKVSVALQINTSVPQNLGKHPGRVLVELVGDITDGLNTQKPARLSSEKPANQPTVKTASKIAFTSSRDGNAEIYAMNADGTDVRRLTNNGATDRLPFWSPDCRSIAFESDREGGARKIYLMDADGGNQRRLTANNEVERFPSFSPDGKKIAFTIYNVDRTADIYTINVDGADRRRLTENSHEDAYPAWSPDGKKVAFHSYQHGKAQIFVMNSDGSGVARLTSNDFGDFEPAWSPDGSQIAFVSNRDGNFEVYSMNADGSNQQRLTRTDSNEFRVTWSPDGRHLIFGSVLNGKEELVVMDKTNLTVKKPAVGDGSLAFWSHC
jgi:Tol biopolymer transport system component